MRPAPSRDSAFAGHAMSHAALVVGLGQIGMGYDLDEPSGGRVHSHARAFSQHPAFHLIGGVDPDERRRIAFARAYGCSAYADLESALAIHQPNVIAVSVPTPMHGSTVLKVLEQSTPKAILCEKPLSYEVNEARSMVEACKKKGVNFYVNYIRRSDPGVIEIKRRILAGELVAPFRGFAWYSKGFFHNGSHLFNLLEYWLGAMESSMVLDRGRLWEGLDPEPAVQVSFELGNVVFQAAWEEAFSHYTIELLCSAGRLRYENGGELINWQPASMQPDGQGGFLSGPGASRIRAAPLSIECGGAIGPRARWKCFASLQRRRRTFDFGIHEAGSCIGGRT